MAATPRLRTAEGDFTLLPARALEACHRGGAEVVIKSGWRRAQVMETRLIGQRSYIFEVGSGMVIDGELSFLTGELEPREGLTVHAQVARSGGPDLLLARYAGRLEHHAPWHLEREVTPSAGSSTSVRRTSCWAARGTGTCGSSTTARSPRGRLRSSCPAGRTPTT